MKSLKWSEVIQFPLLKSGYQLKQVSKTTMHQVCVTMNDLRSAREGDERERAGKLSAVWGGWERKSDQMHRNALATILRLRINSRATGLGLRAAHKRLHGSPAVMLKRVACRRPGCQT